MACWSVPGASFHASATYRISRALCLQGWKPLFALIESDSFYVDGYFEETKLPRIKMGDPARIYLVGESAVIEGHVETIAGGFAEER